MSGDLIILEEAAYCDQQLIAEVVVPLLTVQSSVLICISTLLEGNNHYSRLFEIEDASGNKMFETMQITLVCDECLKTDHPERCTHKLAEMPRWLSSQKMDVVKAILAEDPAMLLRESMGVAADSSNKAFSSKEVDAFAARRVDLDVEQTPIFLLAVDPAGGGTSQFAVASLHQNSNGTMGVRALTFSPLSSLRVSVV